MQEARNGGGLHQGDGRVLGCAVVWQALMRLRLESG